MKEIKVEDFEVVRDEYGYDFTTYFDFWDEEVELTLFLRYGKDEKEELSEERIDEIIEKSLKNLNSLLKKAEGNRKQLMSLLKEKEYIELATEWVEGAEKVEDKENYYLIDDVEVCVPITEEDFEKSLSCSGGMGGEVNLAGEIESLSIYFVFNPDYFAGHCIECYIEEDGSFSINGLAG